MKITRAVGAAALSVAVAASIAAPAVALTTSDGQSGAPSTQAGALFPAAGAPGSSKPATPTPTPSMPPGSTCSELAKKLVTQLPGISSDLTAVPPRTDDATNLITEALNDVTALQKAGCLPNVPSTTNTPPSTTCVADVAKLLAELFTLVSDLSGIPNIPGAVSAAGGLAADVTGLVDNKCLPSSVKTPPPPTTSPKPSTPPVPPVKSPTPSVPPKLAGPPLPTPSPSVPVPSPGAPKIPVPSPSVPVPTPSAPKVPVPTPSKPGLPSLPDNPSLPGLPTMPSLPGASTLPSLPGTAAPSPSHSGKA